MEAIDIYWKGREYLTENHFVFHYGNNEEFEKFKPILLKHPLFNAGSEMMSNIYNTIWGRRGIAGRTD